MNRPVYLRRSTVSPQQQAAALGSPADTDRRDGYVLGDLALSSVPPKLDARLVEKSVAVQPTRGQLAAVWVDREVTVFRETLKILHESSGAAVLAEAERVDPLQRQVGESVVERGEIDVGRGQFRRR